IEKMILASSQPGDLVVDPFAGSGTTAVVAARHGRRFLCGDADARYVGMARARIGGAPPAGAETAKPRRKARAS
ncbi:MAG TPA: DNA methyltransferase, partial [Kofleriaceae bacterium]|nr:DNA methyltransferase [Kofleriaceae bacterium]